MIHISTFVHGLVAVLRSVPQLIADLDPPTVESVLGYYDIQPQQNSVNAAIYEQRPGTILVIYREFMQEVAEGGIVQNAHYADIYVRPKRGQSPWDLIHDITNGIPEPGEGLRWHYCPWLPQLQATEISSGGRETDPENIDLWLVKTKTFEVGDP